MPRDPIPCPKCGKVSKKVWCYNCYTQKRPYAKKKGDKPLKKWKPTR